MNLFNFLKKLVSPIIGANTENELWTSIQNSLLQNSLLEKFQHTEHSGAGVNDHLCHAVTRRTV
jgi:hypothetical protein